MPSRDTVIIIATLGAASIAAFLYYRSIPKRVKFKKPYSEKVNKEMESIEMV